MNQKESLEFWKRPPDKISIESYLDNPNTLKRTEYLVKKVKSVMKSKAGSILDVGCGCGRDLNGLYKDGYKNLFGIDVNEKMLDTIRENYHSLYMKAMFERGSLENVIGKFSSVDVVYSMSCLCHVHPDSDHVFRQIKRIAQKAIITIENEQDTESNRIFKHDYKKLFTGQGWTQFKVESLKGKADKGIDGYTCRIFKKK